jgi:hypothetical protein
MVQSFINNIQEDLYLFYMHGVYDNIIEIYLNELKDNALGYLGTNYISKYFKSQLPSNIQEDELSSQINLKFPCNSIGNIQEFQENPHGGFTKEFISCCDSHFSSPPSPSISLQDPTKVRGTQIRRQLHRIPLHLQEVDFSNATHFY